MEQMKQVEEKLKSPFASADIEFRIAKVNRSNRKALVLPYVTSRAVMDRLDEVIGCANWSDEYEVLETGVTCKLSLQLEDRIITKQDAAPFTNIEALKGAFSDALKRAAVKFGIGRYLYKLPHSYVIIDTEKPENAQARVHYYQSSDFSGWWIEPDLPKQIVQEKSSSQQADSSYDFLSLTLYQKLSNLADLKIITQAKHAEYLKKLQSQKINQGLLKYFSKQCDLLYNLHTLSQRNKINSRHRSELFKKIMSSRLIDFPAIENEIKELEAA